MASRGNRRDQAHAMARTRGFDDGRFTLLAPSTPRMMIGANVGGIAKEDLGFFALRQGFDPRVFLLEPLLYQSLVAFPRAEARRAHARRARAHTRPHAPARAAPAG